MNLQDYKEFYPKLYSQGYTLAEVSQVKTVEQVPQHYLDRYPGSTYNEYIEHLHEFMNGQ